MNKAGGARFLAVIAVLMCAGQAVLLNAGQQEAPAEQQEQNAEQSSQASSPTETRQDQDQAETGLTVDEIDRRLAALTASTELEEAIKAEVSDLYQKARTEIENREQWRAEAQKFRNAIESADAEKQSIKDELEQGPPGFDFENVDVQTPPDELIRRRVELQNDLEKSRSELTSAQAESNRRAGRRTKISEEINTLRGQLGAQAKEQNVDAVGTISPTLADASRILANARRLALAANLDMLEQENTVYVTEGTELLQLRIDAWTARVRQKSEDLQKLVEIITAQRKADAKSQLEDAQTLRDALPEDLREAAASLVDLATKRLRMARDYNDASSHLQRMTDRQQSLKAEFDRMESRVNQGNASGIGVVLIRKRGELPNEVLISRNLVARRSAISRAHNVLFEFEERRADLRKKTVQAKWVVAELYSGLPQLSEDEVRGQLEQCEAALLNDLIRESDTYADLLVRVNLAESGLLNQTRQFHVLIDRNVFWVRSSPPVSLDDVKNIQPAFAWLLSTENWKEAGQSLMEDAIGNPLLYVAFVLLLGNLLYFRRRWKTQLVDLGTVAERPTCREMAPTIRAFVLTLLLAAPGPLLIFFLGWRLSFSLSTFAHALSDGMLEIAYYFAILELIQQTFRPGGLSACHFGRPQSFVKSVRLGARAMAYFFLPLILVADVLQSQNDPTLHHSFGRIAFVAAVIVLTASLQPLLQPIQTSVRQFFNDRRPIVTSKSISLETAIWIFCAAVVVFALSGYYFAAARLVSTMVDLLVLLFCLLVASALLNRWVRVERRTLAYQQAVERRQRELAAGEQVSETEDILVDEDEVDVQLVDNRSRKMIRNLLLICGFIGLLWAFRDLLPALAILEKVQLWPKQAIDDTIVWVTLKDLLFAVLVFVTTFTVAKNLPSFVEILFSNQVNVESSIRYAVGQLSSYLVAAIGIVAGFGILGLTWSKLQWLVAALGVGLGFGLQEIFANFVAGIILLFERPIRVGDVVTVGDTTGVVTKIQIRATTIRNWDRQDLVVPNRDLVTGQLINWTLAGGLNRVTFEVGVAYGSDMRRVQQLLLQVLSENPRVLDSPSPIVTFREFGESSLNVWVAAYLAEIDDRLATTNELHTAIHERFAREGIEIPFPQRDLRVRSIEDVVRTQPLEDTAESKYSATE